MYYKYLPHFLQAWGRSKTCRDVRERASPQPLWVNPLVAETLPIRQQTNLWRPHFNVERNRDVKSTISQISSTLAWPRIRKIGSLRLESSETALGDNACMYFDVFHCDMMDKNNWAGPQDITNYCASCLYSHISIKPKLQHVVITMTLRSFKFTV